MPCYGGMELVFPSMIFTYMFINSNLTIQYKDTVCFKFGNKFSNKIIALTVNILISMYRLSVYLF
jgi:hypothetical protein